MTTAQASTSDYRDHYGPATDLAQLALDIGDDMGARVRSYSSKLVTAGTLPMLAAWSGIQNSDITLFVHILLLAGNNPPEGFDHPAINDTADALADQLNRSPGSIRNSLSRLYKAKLLQSASGRILWRASASKRIYAGARPMHREDRILHVSADYATAVWQWQATRP